MKNVLYSSSMEQGYNQHHGDKSTRKDFYPPNPVDAQKGSIRKYLKVIVLSEDTGLPNWGDKSK